MAACNAGGLAPPDGAGTGDDTPIDGAVIDGRPTIDAALYDAELHDAALYDAELYDAELHDAAVYDAEIPDADPYDAEPAPDAHDPLVDSITFHGPGFLGTWVVSPNGTSCGPDCHMYPEPTDVTITVTMTPGAYLSWGAGPCSPLGQNLVCPVHVEGEINQGLDSFCPTFVVDVNTGSDTNVGTCGSPYKTIGKAASRAVGFQIIRVLPGTYSDATETFPITIPMGTPIYGKENAHGAGVNITTTQTTAFICGGSNDIAGITLSVPNGTGVQATQPCQVRDSVVQDSITGIAAPGAVQLLRTTVRNNTVGLALAGSGADLGTAAAHGDNDLVCNGVDVSLAAGQTAQAISNAWDHAPPTAADVTLGAGASIDVTGAVVSDQACP